MAEISAKSEKLSSVVSKILTASNKSAVYEENAISWLDAEKACILTKTKINISGLLYNIGNETYKEYENTENGKAELLENAPEPYVSAVLAVWGENQSAKEMQKEITLEEKINE